eukprot:TRINITY_DN4987_c0_g1_i1.p1 TRINITY_DN4987_c0_g1~~TRINITY_DN4987_c0_g1_i1.p1  ORF type:complete len:409 (-),score=122.81 TRINITY_DN4987_c0_g1_i1:359-1585(-)
METPRPEVSMTFKVKLFIKNEFRRFEIHSKREDITNNLKIFVKDFLNIREDQCYFHDGKALDGKNFIEASEGFNLVYAKAPIEMIETLPNKATLSMFFMSQKKDIPCQQQKETKVFALPERVESFEDQKIVPSDEMKMEEAFKTIRHISETSDSDVECKGLKLRSEKILERFNEASKAISTLNAEGQKYIQNKYATNVKAVTQQKQTEMYGAEKDLNLEHDLKEKLGALTRIKTDTENGVRALNDSFIQVVSLYKSYKEYSNQYNRSINEYNEQLSTVEAGLEKDLGVIFEDEKRTMEDALAIIENFDHEAYCDKQMDELFEIYSKIHRKRDTKRNTLDSLMSKNKIEKIDDTDQIDSTNKIIAGMTESLTGIREGIDDEELRSVLEVRIAKAFPECGEDLGSDEEDW